MQSSEKAYSDFWDTLIHAYPVSKGTMRLPIATDLLEIPNFDHNHFSENLTQILESLLDTEGTKEKALTRAIKAGDNNLTPLINDEYTGTVRFDCLWNPNTKAVSILEINCDYPDGLLLHDKTFSSLSGEDCVRHKNLHNKLFDKDEVVEVLHSAGAFFLDGYQAESDNHNETGHGGALITDTSLINPGTTIRRCLETTKLTDKHIEDLTSHSSRLINTIALRTLGYKDLLDNIDHPFIPKTMKVTLSSVDFCIRNKDTLVLKPADGCEGFGIYFGHKINDIEWSKLIDQTISKNFVVQELVHIPKIKVNLYENNTIVEKELYYDLCPHFFIKKGKVIGTGHTLMRFSENPIVNVTQGGGIGYYKL